MLKKCCCRTNLFAWAHLTIALLVLIQSAGAAEPSTKPALEGESFFFTPPGFEKEGQPLTARGEETGKLAIVVRDKATGRPTPCRMAVVGADGNYYQPPENRLSKYAITGQWPTNKAWGNRPEKAPWRYLGRYFYSTGETTVDVPAGPVRIEVSKGFEFQPFETHGTIGKGQTSRVVVVLERAVPMADLGYFGGDLHLHFARTSAQDDETICDLLEAEDVWYGTPLGYNEPAGPYAGFMDKMDSPQFRELGVESIKSRGSVQMLSGQEYRSATFGHLNLYLRDRLVFEGQNFNTDDGPAYGVVGAETQSQGGIAIHAHGGYGLEIYADAAVGTVNAVELLQFGIYRGIGLTDWYHMLNTGYRFPAVGASDFPACRFMSDCRTYVWTDSRSEKRREEAKPGTAPRAPEFQEWLRAVAKGQSFMTTGPMILLEVDGARPGEIVKFEGVRSRTVTARVRVRSEVTPVQTIELIVNGKPLKLWDGTVRGRWSELSQPLTIRESSWIAARAYSTTPGGQPDAESHTNPVYVYLDGKAPYTRASCDAWLAQIDKQIEVHTKRSFSGKPQVLAYFQRARDTLLKIRERGGLKADEDPAQLVVQASRLPGTSGTDGPKNQTGPATDLAADGSERNPTDEELREFLKPVPPRSPEEALKSLEVAEGFHAELVAAEPLVFSPVAAAFDEDGNLYVCEMRDYPFKPVEGAKPIGSVRLLRDTNGDGRFDEAHLFAEELLWAAGVAPWKGGVFVAAPPDIWYMKDTDGDFKADVKRRVFTGFGLENQQAMLNNLQFGLDHKIHGSTAGNGGEIRPGNDPSAPAISVKGRDFRFDPADEAFETITGTVQFGNTFDDWGNRFVCSESQPLEHIVLPEEFLIRNPFLATPSAINNIAPGPVPIFRISPIERWRHIRSSRRIAKNERAATSAGASHHVVDAAAGVTIYRGGAYPSEYYGQVFVGDGQNNLVHRRELVPDGVTFQSRRVDENSEFVRSSDIWFRPVNFVNAPDGTLYCLDMSREVLESIHIPLDVVKHLDLASGRNNGRIYRIAPNGFQSPKPPRLSKATSAELVAALDSQHGWWRDTAQRLIYERQDESLIPELAKLFRESRSPQARVCALWSLAGLGALAEKTWERALRDPHPGVRENAVLLARATVKRLVAELVRVREAAPDGAGPRIPLQKLIPLAEDESPRVRFQLAFMLGYAADDQKQEAAAALAKLARRDGGDRWMRAAILSSASESAADLFEELIRAPVAAENDANADFAAIEAGSAILGQVANLIGVRHQPDEIARSIAALAGAAERIGAVADRLLLDLARGLRRAGRRLEAPTANPSAAGWLDEKVAIATAAIAAERGGQVGDQARIAALELVGAAYGPGTRAQLLGLIRPDQSDALQIAAIRGLADDADPAVASELLERLNSLTPDVRRAALDALLSREPRVLALLEAGSRGEVSLADIEQTRRDVLLKHKNPAIRRLAEQVFAASGTRGRKEVLAEYQPALTLPAQASRGQTVFEKNCAVCHQLAGKGFAIGPNLNSSSVRDPAVLLAHILDPNQYLLPNYVQYVVLDKQGRSYSGILAAQTATSITLKKEKDETATILRGDIEELANSGKSLMPEGLEKNIPPQEMADLIAWLQQAATSSPGDPNAERDFGTLPGLIEPERKR